MNYSEIKRRLVNPGERYYYSRVFAICNEFGAIAFVNANNEQEALDMAVDSGHMNCEAMDPDDYAAYSENGWDDSYILAGNAGEPFWSEYLSINEIKRL